jgi:hypothetical protein
VGLSCEAGCGVCVAGEEGKGAGGGIFSLIAKSSQPEGQPLWINYGSCKANSELLIQHGFAVPDNQSDR